MEMARRLTNSGGKSPVLFEQPQKAQGSMKRISAILSAPPCLSGLIRPEVEGFALTWRKLKFPTEMRLASYLDASASRLRSKRMPVHREQTNRLFEPLGLQILVVRII
jgi:hypothetical protein